MTLAQWGQIPKKFRYYTVDPDGTRVTHEHEPVLINGTWTSAGDMQLMRPKAKDIPNHVEVRPSR